MHTPVSPTAWANSVDVRCSHCIELPPLADEMTQHKLHGFH
jgi:hypothetical protein